MTMLTTHVLTAPFPETVAATAAAWLFANIKTFKLSVEGPLNPDDQWIVSVEFVTLDDAAKFKMMFADESD